MPNLKKRGLCLAGGGLKVGFQAGVLEVWLDEAGLTFDVADSASGGCFNLAMYCQGMSGKRIADNWRTLNPFLPIDLNWEHYWRFLHAPSLFTLDNVRNRVLPFWGIDWNAIHNGPRQGTFNYFNFSKKRLETVTNADMDEDQLLACVALPMWFPPVKIDGDSCIDAVFITDANLEELVRRGVDEIWAIWTVSTRDEWRDGFVSQYFHIVETTANTAFFGYWGRIEESNRQIAAGQPGEFGRHIELRLLQAEVPMHYIFNFSKDRMAEAVNLGVKTAREWCRANNVLLPDEGAEYPMNIQNAKTSLSFVEEMKGFVHAGATDPQDGFTRGKEAGTRCAVRLTIRMEDIDEFVVSPEHEAVAEGWIESPLAGGRRTISKGVFNLLVHDTDPARKKMLYRLFFDTPEGKPRTLSGMKDIHNDDSFDVWADTTTLYVRIYDGHVSAAQEPGAPVVAAGIIRIEQADFLRQLTTFRAEGPTLGDRISAIQRFGGLFMGKLWEVYGRRILDVGPF